MSTRTRKYYPNNYLTVSVYKFAEVVEAPPRLVRIKSLVELVNGNANGAMYEPEYTICLLVPS